MSWLTLPTGVSLLLLCTCVSLCWCCVQVCVIIAGGVVRRFVSLLLMVCTEVCHHRLVLSLLVLFAYVPNHCWYLVQVSVITAGVVCRCL